MAATLSPLDAERLARRTGRTIKVWDLPLRLFHWLLAATILVAFLSAEEGAPLRGWHIPAGWTAGVLIVFRLVWGFAGGEHSRFADFVRPSRIGAHVSGLLRRSAEPTVGHNPLGGISVLALLTLVAATVLTGAFGGEGLAGLHEAIAWTLVAVIALHVAAVVVMSLLERENLALAMITGRKPADRHPGAVDARRAPLLGFGAAALVTAGTIYAILQYDPQAFSSQRATVTERHPASVAIPHDDHAQPKRIE